MNPILESERLILRALEPADIDIMMRWENDTTLWDCSGGATLAPYSRLQLAEYLKQYDGDIFTSKQVRLMIQLSATGETIGAIDLFDFDFFNSHVAIGILIDRSFRGQGFGEEALNLATNYAEVYLGIHQCQAIISESNTQSLLLFGRCGYIHTGTLRQWLRCGKQWLDAIIMQHISASTTQNR